MLLAQMCSFKRSTFHEHFGIEICLFASEFLEYCCTLRAGFSYSFLRHEDEGNIRRLRAGYVVVVLLYICTLTRYLVYDAPLECTFHIYLVNKIPKLHLW